MNSPYPPGFEFYLTIAKFMARCSGLPKCVTLDYFSDISGILCAMIKEMPDISIPGINGNCGFYLLAHLFSVSLPGCDFAFTMSLKDQIETIPGATIGGQMSEFGMQYALMKLSELSGQQFIVAHPETDTISFISHESITHGMSGTVYVAMLSYGHWYLHILELGSFSIDINHLPGPDSNVLTELQVHDDYIFTEPDCSGDAALAAELQEMDI